ncbi:hypothetical protein NGRA_2467 [Nosema granulosis]|uniref:Uncharacterized protein n=1 Tax=Nosema granulosis TaxID=83296 RepID=A0A9P6GXE9_9MICR|nr:hypothetical protein NGRA_2467 [Nosema granulosis]
MVDYVALCYILEALFAKNIVQIGLYAYMLLYSIIMDTISAYINHSFNSDDQGVTLNLVYHIVFTFVEIIWTFTEIGIFQEEFSLKYFKRFGASNDLNRAYSVREDLKICIRFVLFSSYVTIIHYFLDVYIDNKAIIILMFISQAQIGIVNASFAIFKNKEIKIVRRLQILNILIGIILRILQFVIAYTDAVQVERYNFYSIGFVEILTLTITVYVSYLDYKNFGKGLV